MSISTQVITAPNGFAAATPGPVTIKIGLEERPRRLKATAGEAEAVRLELLRSGTEEAQFREALKGVAVASADRAGPAVMVGTATELLAEEADHKNAVVVAARVKQDPLFTNKVRQDSRSELESADSSAPSRA